MSTHGFFCRLLLLLLVAAALGALPDSAHANTASVTCSVTTTSVNFGQINPPGNVAMSASGGIQFTCVNSSLAYQNVTLCIGLGQGSGSSISPVRQMTDATGDSLNFQLYKNTTLGPGSIWGNVPSTSTPSPLGPLQFQILLNLLGTYVSPTYTVTGSVPVQQTGVANGSYLNALNGSVTYQALDVPLLGGGTYPATCDGGGSASFALVVQATVANQCAVTAGPTLNLGNVASTATNISGTNTISVTCNVDTPYYIGLAPSNGNTTGSGLMKGSGSNADTVPYQLRSASGTAGAIWGNSATATAVGNGVQGTGTGTSQALTVYATVSSANVTPDTYSDIVTINVNY